MISHSQQTVEGINTAIDPMVCQFLFAYKNHAESTIRNVQTAILHQEKLLEQLIQSVTISAHFESGNLKLSEAKNLYINTNASKLNEIPTSLEVLGQIITLCNEAIAEYQNANRLLSLIQMSERKILERLRTIVVREILFINWSLKDLSLTKKISYFYLNIKIPCGLIMQLTAQLLQIF